MRTTFAPEREMTADEIYRRAGGRRSYNQRRHYDQLQRRTLLGEKARQLRLGLFDRGTAAALARQLGLHRSTVSRDIQAILWELNHGKHAEVCCPCCNSLVTRGQLHFPRKLASILGITLPPEPEEQDEPDDEGEEPLAQAG
jgi:hypothetical protein